MKGVFDTNILIDYLKGISKAKKEFERYAERHISLVTWMELLVGATDNASERVLRGFFSGFKVQSITQPVAEQAVKLRREYKMRLPDAVIFATALELGFILVTRNIRDFPESHPGIRVPYNLP